MPQETEYRSIAFVTMRRFIHVLKQFHRVLQCSKVVETRNLHSCESHLKVVLSGAVLFSKCPLKKLRKSIFNLVT